MDKPLAASTLNKVLAFGLAITLIVWTFGVYMVLPAQAVDAHVNGTVVLSGGTVFKIMGSQRLGYPTPASFLSYNYKWGDIVAANSADLALPQGENVKIADGALINDGGTVFLVYGGSKYGFTSAAVFTGLGYKWSNILTDSLSAYPQGANVDSATMAHPNGTLVNASGTIYQITSTGRAGIPTLAVFQSHGFDFAKSVPANAADLAKSTEANLGYRVGSIVNDGGTIYAISSSTEKRGFPSASCYTDYGYAWSMAIAGATSGYTAGTTLCGAGSGSGSGSGTSTGTLSVSLASDTPAGGIVIANSARAPFTKLALTASGGDVIIDSWVVKRAGVAQDDNFSSIDIVDLSTNAPINDTGKTFTTDHTANFSEDFTVPSGATKYVTLSGNMGSGHSGEMPILALQSITVKGGTVSASFPISGNAMTINTSITIGTATVSRGAYSNATSTALEIGKTGYAFFSFSVAAGSTEDITFKQIKLYQSGTASPTTDLANMKMYKDGEFLADGTVSGNYVNFNFGTAQVLPKGQTRQYQMKADVVSGSARTVLFAIYRTTDMSVIGNTYNSGITPTYSGTSATNSGTSVLTDNQATLSQGTLRVGRSNTVGAENITVGSDQVLGAFEFEVKGEPMIVSALTLTTASTTSGTIVEDALKSVKLVDSNGVTVAGPTDVTNHALTVAFTDSFTIPVGVKVYKVLATVSTNGGWTTNDTVTVSFTPSSAITAKGENTGLSVTPTPASSVSASTQTVKAATLTVTKNSTPTDKSVITNSVGVLAGSWTFDGTNAGENIRITSLAIAASTTNDLVNLTLKDGTTALSPINSTPCTHATGYCGRLGTAGPATSTFALSDPIIITKGTSKVIDLYVDIGSGSATGDVASFGITSTAAVTAYGVTTGNAASVTVTASHGAVLTVAAAGTLTINVDASNPSSRLVVFGTTGVSLSEVRLKATSEPINITKLTLRVAAGGLNGTRDGDYTEVSKIYLKKDGAIIGTSSGYSMGAATKDINLDTGVLQVPTGSTGIKFSVIADIVAQGTNEPGVANSDIKVGLNGANGFTAKGALSNTAATKTYTDSTGSAVILHKAVPSVVMQQPSNKLGATSVLHEAKISAVGSSGSSVGVYQLSYDMSSSTGIRLTNGYLKLTACSGSCGGLSEGTILSSTTGAGTYLIDGHDTWSLNVNSNTGSHGKKYLSIGVGETATVGFVATVNGMTTASDSVSASLLGDTASTTFTTTGGYTTGNAATDLVVRQQGNFAWSDLHLDETQAAASLTQAQWYNGYLVSGLGAASTSTPVTVGE